MIYTLGLLSSFISIDWVLMYICFFYEKKGGPRWSAREDLVSCYGLNTWIILYVYTRQTRSCKRSLLVIFTLVFLLIIVTLINIQSTFMYIHSKSRECVLSLYDFLLIYVMIFSIKRVISFCWVLLCYPRRRRTPSTFWLSCRIGFKDVSITSHLGIFRKTTYGFQISLDVKYYRLEPYSSHAPIPTIPSVLLKK